MDHRSSKTIALSTKSIILNLFLILLLSRETKSMSTRFFVNAWTTTTSSNMRSCRIINRNVMHMPRTILSSSSNGNENIIMKNSTKNDIKVRNPNLFQILNERIRNIRWSSTTSASRGEYVASSDRNDIERKTATTLETINEKEAPTTFFMKVEERVKEIKASKTVLDPRAIFSTVFNNDLTDYNKDHNNKNSTECKSSGDDGELLPEEMFALFQGAIESGIDFNKGLKREDPEDIKLALSWILNASRTTTINLPTLNSKFDDPASASEQLRGELKAQRQLFLQQHSNFTMDQYKLAQKILCVLGDFCAKRMLIAPLIIAWEKVKESGMILREPAMNTYLYVVGNSMPSSLNLMSLPTSSTDDLSFGDDIAGEVALFHDLLYKPTENSITLRVKGLVAKGYVQDAESLLKSYAQSNLEQLRLRTYFPVLKAYCDLNDCASAFRIFNKMRNSPTVKLEAENYVLLLATLTENGVFTNESNQIGEATNLGYSAPSGTVLFNELLRDMSDDVLEINSASARRLYNAFKLNNADSFNTTSAIKELPSLADLPIESTICDQTELVVSRVSINSTTAICPRTKSKLRLIILNMEDKRNFYNKLLHMSQEQYISYTSAFVNETSADSDEASKKLMEFADWLDDREGEPFTAIIDGANAAYFGQNFDHGRFNYHQIMFLVQTLEKMNENPLVVLPYKYTLSSFYSNSGQGATKQKLTFKEREVLKELKDSGKLYRVPAKCLDDYYWMLASVSNQTKSRSGRIIDVPINNEQNRWPGTRPMLLSNDQMRDHKLEVLDPRLFRRWTTSHIVNYNFTAFCRDEDQYDKRNITLSAIDFFSREIQGNPTVGETNEETGVVWHLPVKEWDVHERLCIRIPQRKN